MLPDISLNKRERKVVLALFEGYLLPSPRYQPWPRTYQQAAQRLGKPWTRNAVRKEAERLKLRLSRTGPPLEGPRANYDLAEYLIDNNVLGPEDLGPEDPGDDDLSDDDLSEDDPGPERS